MRVLAALDKFKGTATSAELGEAVAAAARACGADAQIAVVSDGGDGLLDVYGGANRTSTVTGPAGTPVDAAWRLDGATAVIESAQACGLVLAGGLAGNDPMTATSAGVGELVEAAAHAGARRVLIGVGGSACTDGGRGCVDAIGASTVQRFLHGAVELLVCCDVTTRFEDAVRFAPQKGATIAQVALLAERLRSVRREFVDRFGRDVGTLAGSGAAGGLAGGLAALGAQLRPGFDVVADEIGLDVAVRAADVVITGEGRLDDTSFDGKVVGGVAALAESVGTEVVAIVGSVASSRAASLDAVPFEAVSFEAAPFGVVSLTARFGARRAHEDVLGCVREATRHVLTVRAGD